MRARFVIAAFAAAIALAAGHASAADYAIGPSANVVGVARAPQLLVYDDEPGVYVRAYWDTPWQGRRYFPFTGKKPKVGRLERLSEARPLPPPAESYYREWSTISLYPPPPPQQVIVPMPRERTIDPLQ